MSTQDKKNDSKAKVVKEKKSSFLFNIVCTFICAVFVYIGYVFYKTQKVDPYVIIPYTQDMIESIFENSRYAFGVGSVKFIRPICATRKSMNTRTLAETTLLLG